MNDEQLAGAPRPVLHFPTVVGSVVPAYNLSGVTAELKFTGPILADIFLGKITKWNDPALIAVNAGVDLPDRAITVVHRSDGSGTTFVWVDYLSKVSAEWREKVGAATSVNWPVGLGGKGNEGVTQQIKQLPGTIGYVELIYAMANDLPVGAIKNKSGNFVAPTLESVSAAAAGVDLPADTDFRVSIVDASGPNAYPAASFTWLLIRPNVDDVNKATAIKEFLTWMTGPEAAAMAAELHYAPLPASVQALVRTRLGTLRGGGEVLP
jgi:phosphate transport system substrate-binding protein